MEEMLGFKISPTEAKALCGRGFEDVGEEGSIVMSGNMYVWGSVLRTGDLPGTMGNIQPPHWRNAGASWEPGRKNIK